MWFFTAVEPTNKSAHVETDEQREDMLQLAHDRGNDNMVLLRLIIARNAGTRSLMFPYTVPYTNLS